MNRDVAVDKRPSPAPRELRWRWGPPQRGFVTAFLLALLALHAAACSDASGTISGGEDRFDAAPPSPPPVDSGPFDGPSTPATWTELYTSYFGPTGKASCAGSGTCHGDASQAGYVSSKFLCPGGDKNSCYTSITGTAALVTPGGQKPFAQEGLYFALRKVSGGGNMPKSPPYAFTDNDLARIASWLTAGGQNN